jgi:repressor LexA
MTSKKQKLIYDYIVEYVKTNGIAPSLEEIAGHFDFLTHPSSAYYHVKKLQEGGYLERESNKPRSIEIYEDKEVKAPILASKGLDFVQVPVLGSASAGPATQFAEENIDGYLKVSRRVLNKKDGIFALRVEGDSMDKARIREKTLENGDFAIIDSTYRTPKDGDYVLSIIDGCANLKKFQKNKKTGDIMLVSESTNMKYKPIYLSSEDDFMVNGRVIAVIKK